MPDVRRQRRMQKAALRHGAGRRGRGGGPLSAAIYAARRNLVLAASAGTGKTHALVGVVLHRLVAERLDPARVVATTFSRKAAAEIRARVTSELERLAGAPSSSSYAPSLQEATGATTGELSSRAKRALGRVASARFGTLHGFATGIVRSYAIELGLGPGFELASEAESRAAGEEAIARALEARFVAVPGAVRALADAAGGIDRLVAQLRRLLVQLEEDGRPPSALVVPESDEAALVATATTLVEHARALQGTARFEEPARALLDAWAVQDEARLERAAGDLCGVRVPSKKSAEVEAFGAFRATLVGTTNDERGRQLVRSYRARRAFAEHAAVVRDVLVAAAADLEERGRTRASLGFGDILRAARELLRDRPDVATEVGAAIDALLVDEFQDTSRVQRDLVQLLWARPDAREAGRVPSLAEVRDRGLLVVGDRKQSIYGFRGADVGVFAELAVGLAGVPAREALGIPAGVTWEPREPLADFHALRHNRRSSQAILSFANAFSAVRFSPGDPPPELYEIAYVPSTEDLLAPPESSADGADERPLEPRTTWLRISPKGASSSRLEEALVLTERIRALTAGGRRLGDIAVLATTNGMLDAVAFALAQANVPYVVAGRSFFRTREVRDLAALLALVLDTGDRIAALEVLRGPWTGVHDETLLGLTRAGEGLVGPASWPEPPEPTLVHDEDRPRLERTSELVLSLSRCAGRLGPGSILREALRASALEDVLASMPRGEQRVANVRKLLAMADRHADARAFHAWLREAMDQETSETEAATFSEEDDAVRLLTIHASKGLDFPVVFVPEIGAPRGRAEKGAARIVVGLGEAANLLSVRLADDRGIVLAPPSFEAAWADTRRRERAERQRLAYVAVTRAAEEMFFVGGRRTEAPLDPGTSTLGALEALVGHASLTIEDVEVPPSAHDAADERVDRLRPPMPEEPLRPAWRSLPIAPTALADFAHCGRRFELVHVLGLPEQVRQVRGATAGAVRRAKIPMLDARVQGTLAHAVLERLPKDVLAAGETAAVAVSRTLVTEGVAVDHPQHGAIVARVMRFLRSRYAREIGADGVDLRREVSFVLGVDDAMGRTVTLRGSIDLVVAWPDGSVDVIDYKSARSGDVATYAFQLDVYALAARAIFPAAPTLRAGLVFLGGGASADAGPGEPVWHSIPPEREVRERLAGLGERLVDARWTESFPRVRLERCEAIHCGFIGRCHPSAPTSAETDVKPSRETMT